MPERTHSSARIVVLLSLPIASLDQLMLASRVLEIRQLEGASSGREDIA